MSAAPQESPAVDQLVDWELAVRTAGLVVRPGPQLPAEQAQEVVAQLREAARVAVPHVRRVSGLEAPPAARALVIDRTGWTRANVRAFRRILAPVLEETVSRRGKPLPTGLAGIGSRVTGAELGSLLGFLSSRVLGQYDPFGDPPRLLLVAPNVVHIEQELEVVPADFRLWVCLHEETHRVQFGATPWLTEHMLGQVRALVGDLLAEPGQVAERVVEVLRGLPDVVRGTAGGNGLLDAVQTPQQRERLAAVTAVMSLLEGHADVVMDEVGADVVPSVEQIRRRFSRHRRGRGAVDRLLRRLLGLDAKMRQYADGAAFVRGVRSAVGTDGLNAVWERAEHLPRPAEIADPAAWVRRVHG